MRSPLMSGAKWQEGAGGAMLVDGAQDGGRVNNTQTHRSFSLFMTKRKEEKKEEEERILSPAVGKDQTTL